MCLFCYICIFKTYTELILWELTSWEVALVGIDLVGVDLVGVDLVGVDLVGGHRNVIYMTCSRYIGNCQLLSTNVR